MTKWYNWLPFQTHPRAWDVLEELEDIFTNKGNLRVLLVLFHASGLIKGYFQKKPLRFMEIKETCQIPISTLQKSLERLSEKGLIEVVYKDVTKPKTEKNVPHYVITHNGFKICELFLMSFHSLLIIPTDVPQVEKYLIKNERTQ